MKNILMAAAVLLVLASCGNKTEKAGAETAAEEVNLSEIKVVSNRIAFVDMDSLLARFDMAIDLRADLESKGKKAESELTTKGRAFEKAYVDAEEKVSKGLVTRAEAAKLEEDLQKQQQGLVERREKLAEELAEENQVVSNKVYHAITDYLKKFNSDYGYAMILTTSGGVPILNADPSLNITATVLKGLNEEYAKNKPAQSKPQPKGKK